MQCFNDCKTSKFFIHVSIEYEIILLIYQWTGKHNCGSLKRSSIIFIIKVTFPINYIYQ